MLLFLIAFVAGVLTVLAPCVLPLLPIIVGGSVSGGVNTKRAYTVALSLGLSVILFTLILKFSTAFIGVPQYAWEWFSGGVLILFGIVTLFPRIWDSIGLINKISRESNKAMSAGFMKQSFWGDVLVGAALGPVFSTCSPTYFVILATVLPASFFVGLVDLFAYTAGLVLMLLIVSLVGQRIVDKLGLAADTHGWFRKSIGALFIVVGVLVFLGAEKNIESWLIDHVYDITTIEQTLLQARANDMPILMPDTKETADAAVSTAQSPDAAKTTSGEEESAGPTKSQQMATLISVAQKTARYPKAPEITKPDGYVNTGGKPITIAEFKGKKVVLIDFWTYSCINCQRTLPYLKTWDEKYRDQGLETIGIHTPEFAFERVQSNVEDAVQKFGLKYPSVLDNNYGTWNAFGNSYWPRKYLIDIDGFVVYDHAGEGDYDETEKEIQKALAERAARLGAQLPDTSISVPEGMTSVDTRAVGSPEIYFGSARNEYFANGSRGRSGIQTLTLPTTVLPNALYFGGSWNIQPQYAESVEGSQFEYRYRAKAVYFVGGTADGNEMDIEVQRDGKPLDQSYAGKDIIFRDGKSYVRVSRNTLYKVIEDSSYGEHTLLFIVPAKGLQAYTFTFG